MTKPTVLYNWATDPSYSGGPASGTPTRVAPTGGQQTQGLRPGDQLGAQLLGALFGNLFDWVAWLTSGTPDGDFTIAGNLTVGGQPLAFTDFTFTADHLTSLFTRTAHGLSTGDGPVRLSNSGGALPSGLVAGVDYYVIKVDANTFKIAASRDCALERLQIDFLGDGTGTQTLQHQAGTTRVTDTTCSRSLSVGGASTLHDVTVGGEVFTLSSTVFVANSTTDTIAVDNHPLRTGDGPLRVSNSGGALPTGLLAATDYWAIRTNSGKFQLATSRANALVGAAIDLTTSGTGTNSIVSGTSASHTNTLVVHGTISADDFSHGLDTDFRAPADGLTSSIGLHPCSFQGSGWALNTSAEGIFFTFPRLRAGDHVRSWTVWFTKASSGSETLSAVFEHWDDGSVSKTNVPVAPGTAFGPSVSIGGTSILQTSASNPGFTSMGVTGLDVIVQQGQQFEISIVNAFSSGAGTATGDIIVSAKVTFDRP